MSDEVKLSMIWGAVVATVLSSLIWGIAWYAVSTTRHAMENGYTQTAIPGAVGAYWVKGDGDRLK